MQQLQGAIVAIITPFRNGKFDEDAYRQLIENQIENGISGIVPCGTTGESTTLSHEEHQRVIRVCIEQVAGRVPVIAGTGSNSTAEAISLTEHALKDGADAALSVTPYYNKPSQEGLYQHYRELDRIGIPIVLYNVPGRCGVDLLPETVARLAELDNIVAIKDATSSMIVASEIRRLCGDKITLLSGDDLTALGQMALGGRGVISVISNIIPGPWSQMAALALAGDFAAACEIHDRYFHLNRLLYLEANPIPVKTAVAMMGKCADEFRLPLTNLSPGNREILAKELARLELIRA
ncbi:4-hydroxy-tetrahydrodipicolinate synthase [Desulfurispirillum indicum]|uniref:4-hydroxy-tetrahydrodipicolinate synthase n=1 Tax=Desulfurispirillum indicum (strain ATCC BAA-1389 / DSM 22839 / S5) TaxID=653733 RepID=E6W4T0_DESIS|nr:4-hydroxy-tetrahydrodipicolinate synthase [Desulfurispirillum indicum]ADU64808.1 dihydrodipicolinate synthase [Desulfurispirillum indicum S5]UCZ56742.1 4-hydroxy-tetrahydrodipicolinate synthase [Desulfurispirillum indicum]